MLYLHVYGFLKQKFDPKAKLSDQTIIPIDYITNESFLDLLKRINLVPHELGDCFINGNYVSEGTQLIPNEARIGLFSTGMQLHEGGDYLKFRSVHESK